jgi:hypothetical protein
VCRVVSCRASSPMFSGCSCSAVACGRLRTAGTPSSTNSASTTPVPLPRPPPPAPRPPRLLDLLGRCRVKKGTRQWTHLPSTLQTPPVCSYPFLFVAGCHLCVFGGQSLNDVAVTNELYMLDTSTRTASLPRETRTRTHRTRTHTHTTAHAHDRTTRHESSLTCFLWCSVSLTWTRAEEPRVKGHFPGPRDMGVANVVDDTCLLYGGYSIPAHASPRSCVVVSCVWLLDVC